MIVPIKIQCGCGQRYLFEAEIGSGQMPFRVTCPVCGTDGTGAANTAIAQFPQAQAAATPATPAPPPPPPTAAPMRLHISPAAAATPPPPPTSTPPRLHVSTPATAPVHTAAPAVHAPGTAPAPRRLLPGQVSPEQALAEARAKIFWGDPQEDVVKYLMMQGNNVEEASGAVREMFAERVSTLRGIGFRKIFTGIPLICVPIATVAACVKANLFPSWIIALTGMAGLYGGWLALRGTILVLSPKSETCDVADE